MKENLVKQRLLNGGVVLGVTLNFLHPGLAEFLGRLGFDCLIVDGEHGSVTDGLVEEVTRAADSVGAVTIIRTPFDESIQRYLDMGVSGVQIPHVGSDRVAREILDTVKFPPFGRRGIGSCRASVYGLGEGGIAGFVEWSNRETLVIVQIEDRRGLEALPKIAGMEGIDVILAGPVDLSQDFGVVGQTSHPDVQTAIGDVMRCARDAGKVPGLPARNPGEIPQIIQRGARFILTSASAVLALGARDFLEAATST